MTRPARWFLIWGCFGIFAATAVYALGSISALRTNTIFNPYVFLALAPASILGLADPTTLRENWLILGIVLGTNFILYGLLGLILCGAWSFFRHRTAA